MVNAFNLGVLCQEVDDPLGIKGMAVKPERERLDTLQQQKCVER